MAPKISLATHKEKSLPSNYDFNKYKILRDRIIDKVHEVIVVLDDTQSSVNKYLDRMQNSSTKINKKDLQQIIITINNNADHLLASDNTASDSYFESMKDLTKNIKNLHNIIEPNIYTADSIDDFSPQEASDTLKRIINDFNLLDKAEGNFPRTFREEYVENFEKKEFF
ncbi:MAG: hypothetical protein ACJARD_000798 [Alphaproteobacteria bacterium]|jgi:hypothetical protein